MQVETKFMFNTADWVNNITRSNTVSTSVKKIISKSKQVQHHPDVAGTRSSWNDWCFKASHHLLPKAANI